MILCADDYGLREDIDHAILQLCHAGRLTAVSCMALLERCDPACAANLLTHQGKVDIGLHLCLTDEGLALSGQAASLSLPPFRTLLRRCLLGAINKVDMLGQIEGHYELFVHKFGRTPDFVDGHLHTHQLPMIREALIEFVLSLPDATRPYIRNTYLPLRRLVRAGLPWLKAAVIRAFGARFVRLLRRVGLQTNTGFAGIYSFGSWRKYDAYLAGFTGCLDQNGILVVHPGLNEAWRKQEFTVLSQFPFKPHSLNRFQKEFDRSQGSKVT